MAYFVATISFILAALVPSIICDYQLEVTLITYNNSQGRLQDGSCCDVDNPRGGCLIQDTCDVRFTFSVQNFHTSTTFHSQTKVLDRYDDMDVISFPNCSVLINSVRNPLNFVIPTSQWSAGEGLRLQAAIVDVDRDPTTGAIQLPQILGTTPILALTRPAAPSAIYSSTQTFNGANSLTMTYQYRVICTPGTCGSDCSQTSNCEPFTSCTPITCDDQPCLNGGTCNSVSDGYTCTCPAHCNSQPNCAMCDDPCPDVNPCLNGGTCNAMGATFTCTCRQGFTGDRCRDADLSTTSAITTTAVLFTDTSTGVQTTNGGVSGPSSDDESTTEAVNQTDRASMLVASLTIMSCVVLMKLFFFD